MISPMSQLYSLRSRSFENPTDYARTREQSVRVSLMEAQIEPRLSSACLDARTGALPDLRFVLSKRLPQALHATAFPQAALGNSRLNMINNSVPEARVGSVPPGRKATE